MRLSAILFLVGITLFQQLSHFPTGYLTLLLLGILPIAYVKPRIRPFAAIVFGFFWAYQAAYWLLLNPLPNRLEGQDISLSGVIASIPQVNRRRTRFKFDVVSASEIDKQGNLSLIEEPFPKKIMLSWYQQAPVLRPGEQWQFTVRLKRPHGFRNPGGFDYEGWLFRHGIGATGYIRNKKDSLLLQTGVSGYAIIRARYALYNQITSAIGSQPFVGVVMALAIGHRDNLSADQWSVFTQTGTNHLMAISGLHVGLVSGLLFFLCRRLWSLSSRAIHWLEAPKAAAIIALLGATGYAAMAGFAIPTQRALIMVAVVMLAIIFQRSVRPSRVLAMALIIILLIDPLAVLDVGFWLSFLAVSVILIGMLGRLQSTGLWWKWGRAQWLVFIGLTPGLLFFFSEFSLISPLANLVAIPWVSLVTVPLSLLGASLVVMQPWLGALLLQLAQDSVALLWPLLSWLASLDFAQWSHSPPPTWTLLPGVLACLLLLAPTGFPGRWLGLLLLLPMLLVHAEKLPHGQVKFTLLDVGQGLSAVVQTRNHVLVFDTGPRFNSQFNTGEAVVLPFLRDQVIESLDILLISHGDNDHIGGTQSLLQNFSVDRVITGVPEKIDHPVVEPCYSPMTWEWDGVTFTLLHPPHKRFPGDKKGNNLSCVLRVVTDNGTLLLSADIEKLAEHYLVQNALAGKVQKQIKADLLVVPHHGSKTSSSAEFLDAVRPKIALFPVGYRNRYGFPKNEVVKRYRKRNIELIDTAVSGAITYNLGGEEGIKQVDRYRISARRYWHQDKRASYISIGRQILQDTRKASNARLSP